MSALKFLQVLLCTLVAHNDVTALLGALVPLGATAIYLPRAKGARSLSGDLVKALFNVVVAARLHIPFHYL